MNEPNITSICPECQHENPKGFMTHVYTSHAPGCPRATLQLENKIEEVYSEAYRLARKFHERYEEYAPQFGYKTREDTKEFDPTSPNGRTMARVCYEIIEEEISQAKIEERTRIIEIAESMKREEINDLEFRTADNNSGYNQALQDLSTKIKT